MKKYSHKEKRNDGYFIFLLVNFVLINVKII